MFFPIELIVGHRWEVGTNFRSLENLFRSAIFFLLLVLWQKQTHPQVTVHRLFVTVTLTVS